MRDHPEEGDLRTGTIRAPGEVDSEMRYMIGGDQSHCSTEQVSLCSFDAAFRWIGCIIGDTGLLAALGIDSQGLRWLVHAIFRGPAVLQW
jgi:hypothetical protein